MTVNWYLVRVRANTVIRSYIREVVNEDGTTSQKLYEEQITQIIPFPVGFEPAFAWSCAYEDNPFPQWCLLRVIDAELPEGFYERKLETEEDWNYAYQLAPSLKSRFDDQPF